MTQNDQTARQKALAELRDLKTHASDDDMWLWDYLIAALQAPVAPASENVRDFVREILNRGMAQYSVGNTEVTDRMIDYALATSLHRPTPQPADADVSIKPRLGKPPEWFDCPICRASDMRKDNDGLIHCVNHNCASNGGKMFSLEWSVTQPPANVSETMAEKLADASFLFSVGQLEKQPPANVSEDERVRALEWLKPDHEDGFIIDAMPPEIVKTCRAAITRAKSDERVVIPSDVTVEMAKEALENMPALDYPEAERALALENWHYTHYDTIRALLSERAGNE